MPIPELVDNVLPEGVHDCTVEEVAAVFCRFQRTDRRMRLTDDLRRYLAAAKPAGVLAVVIDGSYTTAKDEPEDIDLIVVLPTDWDFDRVLRPFEYNAVTKNGIRRMRYPFDVAVRAAGSATYFQAVEFFTQLNPTKDPGLTTRSRKGLLRIVL